MASASLIAHSVKSLPAMPGDPDSTPGSGRSPGEGNGNPVQYSCLENPMDREAWQATVYGVARAGHDWVTKDTQPIGYVLKSLEKKLHFSKNHPGLKQSG